MMTETSVREDIELISRIGIITSILDVICRSTGMGFSCVARVTDNKWIACSVKDDIAFGLQPGGELALESTICNEIRQHHSPVIIDWVEKDETFCGHHTPLQYGFQSYISFPIFLKDKSFFGTLCAIDPKPAELNNPKIIGLFTCFVDLISLHIDQERDLANTQFNYTQEKETGRLRESFIATLGHDLRTPVTAISAASELLKVNEENKNVVSLVQRSVKRINNLIEAMLDLARGRLSGGITSKIESNDKLGEYLAQVIDELAIAWPDKKINVWINLDKPVKTDNNRIAQLFSNLLSNALKYGAPKQPVEVAINSNNEQLLISVTNSGNKISEETAQNLFRPFSRGAGNANRNDGLGLGLYIAQEIARAHNGKVTVDSTDEQTTATFEMPLKD